MSDPNPDPSEEPSNRPARGFVKARHMRKWAGKKGGYEAAPDGFVRSCSSPSRSTPCF